MRQVIAEAIALVEGSARCCTARKDSPSDAANRRLI
jgi:hypothetical protein